VVDETRVVYDSADTGVITKIQPGEKPSVVLTFDDGPGRHLKSILDSLAAENAEAAFFWQTRLLYPERPWERVLDEGHTIGTHSSRHKNLAAHSYIKQYRDLWASREKIRQITGKAPVFFRPPFGQYNEDTIQAANELGLKSIMWRIASLDWELKGNPEKIICNVTDHLEDGAIILLHELKQTADILPELLKEIKLKGYSFASL
jgi:peptidoglycan/xylan/chitin deacetylase (PgdA/CDA1 family)